MKISNSALSNSLLNFVKISGKVLNERCDPFYEWQHLRIQNGLFPYSRVLFSPALHNTVIANEFGLNPEKGINFSSQDYLGLTFRQEFKDAVSQHGMELLAQGIIQRII